MVALARSHLEERSEKASLSHAVIADDARAHERALGLPSPIAEPGEIVVASDEREGEHQRGWRRRRLALDRQPRPARAAEPGHGHERRAHAALDRHSRTLRE